LSNKTDPIDEEYWNSNKDVVPLLNEYFDKKHKVQSVGFTS